MAKANLRTRKKEKKVVIDGMAHIHTTFNNTIITFTDLQGNAVCWAAAGESGFKGARKSTPFAAQIAGERATKVASEEFGMKTAIVCINGPGPGRDSAYRAVASLMKIREIRDTSSLAFNGCRKKKQRRT